MFRGTVWQPSKIKSSVSTSVQTFYYKVLHGRSALAMSFKIKTPFLPLYKRLFTRFCRVGRSFDNENTSFSDLEIRFLTISEFSALFKR